MSQPSIILTISAVHLMALISPGPDFFMAVRNSLRYSRKTGIYTAIGFGLGIAVHISYCLAGLALVISQSILLFSLIKYLGAAYLIYIGLKSFFAKSEKLNIDTVQKETDISPFQAIKMGFLTNVLNPKATLFFLGLFTIVITPETPALALAIASIIMVVMTMLWFSLVAVFFTNGRIKNIYNKFQKYINKILGGVLILLGIKIALTER